MQTDTDAETALQHLFVRLEKMGGHGLISEIRKVVAMGTLAKVEGRGGEFEYTRRAYSHSEAYLFGVRLLLSAIDPLVMAEEAERRLTGLGGWSARVEWQPDSLEGAQPSPEALEVSAVPSLSADDFSGMQEEAFRVVKLIDAIEEERR